MLLPGKIENREVYVMTVEEIRVNISERGWKIRTKFLISVPGEDPLIGDSPDGATQDISIAVWPAF